MSPNILHFHITSRCPFNCKHCCSESGHQDNSIELDRASIFEMLNRAVQFGMDEIDISGGEPLIIGKSPLVAIIAYASKQNLLSTINTNAWFLDEQYVSNLKDAGLDRIRFSLYGTSPGTHDDTIFYWLGKGHRAMQKVLGFEKSSHNLYSSFIEMLTILQENRIRTMR